MNLWDIFKNNRPETISNTEVVTKPVIDWKSIKAKAILEGNEKAKKSLDIFIVAYQQRLDTFNFNAIRENNTLIITTNEKSVTFVIKNIHHVSFENGNAPRLVQNLNFGYVREDGYVCVEYPYWYNGTDHYEYISFDKTFSDEDGIIIIDDFKIEVPYSIVEKIYNNIVERIK